MATVIHKKDVVKLVDELDITPNLARDLLITAGGNADIVREASQVSGDVNEAKARIIDIRLSLIEREKDNEHEESIPKVMQGIVTERPRL